MQRLTRALVLMLSCVLALPAFAQNVPNVTNAGTNSAWSADVATTELVGRSFAPEELALIKDVNAYFNGIVDLKGRFLQTDAQSQTARGRFYVKRPGKFRFVYSPPSRLVILSDGAYLSIEDYDLNTIERYSLSSTPFRILLASNVDVLRDARVTDVASGEQDAKITLVDRENEANGRIRLVFNKASDDALELKEWVVTDAQGLDTKIEVDNLVFGEPASSTIFKPSKTLGGAHSGGDR